MLLAEISTGIFEAQNDHNLEDERFHQNNSIACHDWLSFSDDLYQNYHIFCLFLPQIFLIVHQHHFIRAESQQGKVTTLGWRRKPRFSILSCLGYCCSTTGVEMEWCKKQNKNTMLWVLFTFSEYSCLPIHSLLQQLAKLTAEETSRRKIRITKIYSVSKNIWRPKYCNESSSVYLQMEWSSLIWACWTKTNIINTV